MAEAGNVRGLSVAVFVLLLAPGGLPADPAESPYGASGVGSDQPSIKVQACLAMSPHARRAPISGCTLVFGTTKQPKTGEHHVVRRTDWLPGEPGERHSSA